MCVRVYGRGVEWTESESGLRVGAASEVKVKPLTHINVNLVHLLKVRSLAFSGGK